MFNIRYGIVQTGYLCKVAIPFKVERQKLNKKKKKIKREETSNV